MSPDTVARIASGRGLGRLALSAILILTVGCALYGAAFGLWRSPLAAVYSTVKLPILVLGVALTTTLINSMLAALLRAPLGLRQSAVCMLVGFATTGAALGALSPIAAWLAWNVAPPDPSVLGLSDLDPRAASEIHRAQLVLLFHVAVIATAGVLGNARLYAVLRQLTGRRRTALRVLFAWLAVDFFVGAQLSWNLRPFLGRPHMPVTFFDAAPFAGSFYGEVATAALDAMPPAGWLGVGLIAVVWALVLRRQLRGDGMEVELGDDPGGLRATRDETAWTVPWSAIRAVSARRATGMWDDGMELVLDVTTGPAARLLVRFEVPGEAEARATAIQTELARRARRGPFR